MEKSCSVVLVCILVLHFINDGLCVREDEHSRALPFCRSKNEVKTRGHNRSLVIVSTLDGLVSAIDAKNGQMLWSFLTGPDTMLSSSISRVQVSKNGKWMRLIPSLDGSLYKFDGTNIEALPISADSLLRSSIKLADDSVISGCNENRVYGINYENGKLRYVCNATGCQNYASVNDDDAVIVIRRRTQTVRAIDPRTGTEKWNYSVGQHELAYIESASDSCGSTDESDFIEVEDDAEDDLFYENLNVKFITPEGRVFGITQNDPKNIIWRRKFHSPIIDAWSLHHRNLEQMDLLSTVYMPTHHIESSPIDLSATFYIGIHDKQLYIQQSRSMLDKINRGVFYGEAEFPRIQWKPYLVTALSRTPVLVGENAVDSYLLSYLPTPDVESTALMVRQDSEYPYDGGFYIFPEETPIDNILVLSNDTDGNEGDNLPVIVIASLSYWWKELAFIAFIFITLNLLVTRYFWKRRMSEKLNTIENNNNSLLKSVIMALQSEKSLNSDGTSQRSSSQIETPPPPTGEFVSRYLTDFEPIQCLGRGGFGVVFQARNKIDDCDYAIKRIGLPNRDEAREKVMREVKALAKLDHVGIVRYYNAWLELPPPGWQENVDKLWEEKGLLTSSCMPSEFSTDLHTDKKNININPLHPFGDSFLDNERELLSDRQGSSFGFSFNNRRSSSLENKTLSLLGKPVSLSDEDFGDDDDSLNSKCTSKSQNKDEKSAEISTDSFIVFEDSGCGDYKQSSDRSNNNNSFTTNKDQRNGDVRVKRVLRNSTSEGSNRVNKSSDTGRLWRPNSLVTSIPSAVSKPSVPRIYLHIQQQLCKKENLKDWLASNVTPRDKFQVLDFFEQIVCAVEYVHSQGLMHRDLKPSNIFFAMDGTIKVGDFGLVATMSDGTHEHTPCGDGPIRIHTDKVGTQLYMSPEQVSGQIYSHKVDIFSLGLIFFELITPFSTQMERLRVLLDLKRHVFPKKVLEELPDECAFVTQMLSNDPESRPSASEIRQHSLLKDFQPRPEVLWKRHSRSVSRTFSMSSSSGSVE